MAVTLAAAKAQARALADLGERSAALARLEQLLGVQPLDDEIRLTIAAELAHAGKRDEAGEIYRALTLHLVRAGRPLAGLVGAHGLRELGMPYDYLLGALAEMYAAGSPSLAPFAARPAPPDPRQEVPDFDNEGQEAEGSLDQIAARATTRALDFSQHPPHQAQVHPLPFLSELAPDPLRALLAALLLRPIDEGAFVVRQGDPGTSLYLVALGQLRVETTLPDGSTRELARIHENSLFGEMALVTSQPRGASVIATTPAVVLELARQDLEDVRARMPGVDAALARFTRERLIRNLLATSPLFTPFTREQQGQLLKRFEGVDVDAGSVVIAEGVPGQGLYVVLAGELEVVAQGVDAPVSLARLHPGDVFGEMSLLGDQPTTATVRALGACTLLFLPRIFFERLTDAVPEIKGYFAKLAQRRAADNSAALAGALPEVTVDLDDSDRVVAI